MVEKTTNIGMEILSLYTQDYRAKYHLREIAKILKKNHATIHPHIHNLEKDGILSSENRGKTCWSASNGRNVWKKFLNIYDKVQAKNEVKKTRKNSFHLEEICQIFWLKEFFSFCINKKSPVNIITI